MFGVTRRADYGVRIMIELGLAEGQGRLTSARLARKANVPLVFALNIVVRLDAAGLLRTTPGPSGWCPGPQPGKHQFDRYRQI
jgi:DNA-binding IscR family transcriptional regulator